MTDKQLPEPYLFTDEDKQYLKKIKLMVGTPMAGGQSYAQYSLSVLGLKDLCKEYGIDLTFSYIFNESFIIRARNLIAHNFLKSNFTHLLFIDADVGFIPKDVLLMLLQKKNIIGGSYPKKSINWYAVWKAARDGIHPNDLKHFSGFYVVNMLETSKPLEVKIFEPLPIKQLGTGFMLISRAAFDLFKQHFPKESYRNNMESIYAPVGEQIGNFFYCSADGTLITEDYYFCDKMREIGETIYLMPCVYLTHTGTYEFNGCMWCSGSAHPIHEVKRVDACKPKPD